MSSASASTASSAGARWSASRCARPRCAAPRATRAAHRRPGRDSQYRRQHVGHRRRRSEAGAGPPRRRDQAAGALFDAARSRRMHWCASPWRMSRAMPHSPAIFHFLDQEYDLDADPSPIALRRLPFCLAGPVAGPVLLPLWPARPADSRADPGRTRAGRSGRRCRARHREGAGHRDRICLDDLSALRAFLDHDLSRVSEALHRYRQGAVHFPRIPARCAGRRGLHAGALRRQGQIHAGGRDPVRQAAGMDGARSRSSRCRTSPSNSDSPTDSSTNAWRIRRCSTASRRCATAPSKSSVSIPPRLSSSTAKNSSATCRSTPMAKEIDPYLKEG